MSITPDRERHLIIGKLLRKSQNTEISDTARSVSVYVLCLVCAVTLLVLLPARWFYLQDLAQLRADPLQFKINSLSVNLSDEALVAEISQTPRLQAFALYDGEYKVIMQHGSLPSIEPGLYAQSRARYADSRVEQAMLVQTREGFRVLTVTFDAKDISRQAHYFLSICGVLAMLVALGAKIGTLMFVQRKVVGPLRKVVTALRLTRTSGERKSIDSSLHGKSEFVDLVNEYNYMIEAQMATERQVEMKQLSLEYLAHHDQLTHLPNRLRCKKELSARLNDATKNKSVLSIFLVDLDHFKLFNDQFDQQTGDVVVAETARRLAGETPESQVVGRLDGDEFILILDHLRSEGQIQHFAQRLLEVVKERFIHRGGTFRPSASIGVAWFPDHSRQADELMSNAQFALEEAKSDGRGCYKLFNESMRAKIVEKVELEKDLRIALEQRQFILHYQPKLDLDTRKVLGSEALIRWNHPTRGFVRPDHFIPLAEEAGLVIPMGRWIIETVARQIAVWEKIGIKGLQVAINISAIHFQDASLLADLINAVQRNRIQPWQIEVEITESAIMNDPNSTIETIQRIKDIGFGVAIDDFGTGYSSLSYLKLFPVNTLKIDQAFVRNLEEGSDDMAIACAVIELCKHFKMKTVAEGIEHAETLELLYGKGCDVGQGYYIAKPMNSVDYTKWFVANGGMFALEARGARRARGGNSGGKGVA